LEALALIPPAPRAAVHTAARRPLGLAVLAALLMAALLTLVATGPAHAQTPSGGAGAPSSGPTAIPSGGAAPEPDPAPGPQSVAPDPVPSSGAQPADEPAPRPTTPAPLGPAPEVPTEAPAPATAQPPAGGVAGAAPEQPRTASGRAERQARAATRARARARAREAAQRRQAVRDRNTPDTNPRALLRIDSLLPSAEVADDSSNGIVLLAAGALLALVLASGSLLSVATRVLRGGVR
jgi:type IV secretory pathway VirB10-like protein